MTMICGTSPESKKANIGYENADFILDACLPLDSEIARLGLQGRFDSVIAEFVLSKVHGDCSLTHAALGLADLLTDGGELIIRDLSTQDIARDAIRFFETGKPVSGQVREKLLFPPPEGEQSSILFQQNLMSIARLKPFFPNLEVIREPNPNIMVEIPDQVDLGGKDVSYDNVSEAFTRDRPTCVLCNRPSTKQDHDRSLYSRYCKDHYHKARKICDQGLREAYVFEVKIKIVKEEMIPDGLYSEHECESRAHQVAISMGIDGEKCSFLEDPFSGKSPSEIMTILDERFSESMVIYGDPNSTEADVYDLVLKFAEDKFRTMRHDKDWFGYFVVATNPIET